MYLTCPMNIKLQLSGGLHAVRHSYDYHKCCEKNQQCFLFYSFTILKTKREKKTDIEVHFC